MSSILSYIASFFYSTEEIEEIEEIEEKLYDATFKMNKYDRLETSVNVKNNSGKYSCFATEPIKAKYYTRYRGEYINEYPENDTYTWEIYDYDEETGESYYEDVIKYLDATNIDYWTKHIRHADTEEESNVTFTQYLDRMYYIISKDIESGEELLIWCSEKYRDILKASEE